MEGTSEENEVVTPEVEVLDETEAPAPEPEETPDESKDSPNESVRETVAKSLKALKASGNDAGNEDEENTKPELPKTKDAGAQKVKPVQEETEPPARLSANDKQVFNKLPPPLRMAVARMFKDHQAQFSRTTAELSASQQESKDAIEAVKPFLALWGERGLSPGQAIRGLASAQHNLLNDPEKYLPIIAQSVLPEGKRIVIVDAQGNQVGGVQQKTSDPEVLRLSNTLKSLQDKEAEREQAAAEAQQRRIDQAAETATNELKAVREEKDASGNYLYPEMHNDSFWQQARPLVSALRDTSPGLSLGDAARKAYFNMYGGDVPKLNQTRPSANTQQNNRAQAANVSVRGRTASNVASGISVDAIPPEALRTPADTARWAYEQIQRGR